jgi:parallel beta-helix repeat protein
VKRIFLFFIMISFIFLSGCGGIIPTGYTITSTAGAGGSVTPTGVINVTEGGSQTFTITPDSCSQINDVLVDGISEGSITTYTFTDVQENHTIQVSFVVIPGPRVLNTTTEATYTTIQAAINAALAGDTLIVCPATYYENIIFDNKNITLQSTDPSNPSTVEATIIRGTASDSVVKFIGGDTSTLEGFKIANGNAIQGGGIYITNSSSPTIKNNTITGNTAILAGGGIFVFGGNPNIENNTFTDNTTIGAGGGICIRTSYPAITGNTITGNTANFGGGIYIYSHSYPTIIGNTISGNIATGSGGGIHVTETSSPTVEDNMITDNQASALGGGILVGFDSHLLPTVDSPTGWGALRQDIPIGVMTTLIPMEGVSYTIAGNTFLGNEHGTPLNYTEGAHVYFF